jgi:hypothetical protein
MTGAAQHGSADSQAPRRVDATGRGDDQREALRMGLHQDQGLLTIGLPGCLETLRQGPLWIAAGRIRKGCGVNRLKRYRNCDLSLGDLVDVANSPARRRNDSRP